MKYTDFLQAVEKDPEYKQAKESLKLVFALADAVLRARIQRGWSQSELADRIGTKQANISRIESGLANPTSSMIQKLTEVLELETNFVPAPSSTSYKSFSFGTIHVPNWPVSLPQGTQSQTQTVVTGEQK
jgi:ribosome-binding protein aMBF1 (putative translation factor)